MVQQVAAPKVLYDEPVNLFVAGFIGSPAMNFLPATLEGDTLTLPFGDTQLPHGLASRIESDGRRDVIAGMRPEHFEDAAVADERRRHALQGQRRRGGIDGSEHYAYFDVEASRTSQRNSRSWPRMRASASSPASAPTAA